MTNELAILLLEAYKSNLTSSCSNQLDGDIEAFDIAIKSLQNGRSQGEWINEYYDDGWFHTCNRCKEELKATGEDNFCPNCGADMRKGSME